MDLETIQLLNLSPIPELSEMELSTMLEQLSSLSDFNGDVTDRNVEDILKEAEDLIDMPSSSSRQNEPKPNKQNRNQESLCEEPNSVKKGDAKTLNDKTENLIEANHQSPIRADSEMEHQNSPVEKAPNKIYSPGGSINVIRSTIDSLKEYSNLMEKQISSKVLHSPTKSTKELSKNKDECKIKSGDEQKKKSSPESVPEFPITVKPVNIQKSKTKPVITDKSVRLLNCFERLYQDRPLRLYGNRKAKTTDKLPKTVAKKKHVRDFKAPASLKDKKQIKSVVSTEIKDSQKEEKLVETLELNKTPPKTHTISNWSIEENKELSKTPPKTFVVDNWLKEENKDLSEFSSQPKCSSQAFSEGDSDGEFVLKCATQNQNPFAGGFHTDDSSRFFHAQVKEDLIRELLRQMEEIKVQLKKAGVFATDRSKEESSGLIGEVEFVGLEDECKSPKSSGIQRLEKQFSSLKDKYNQQVEKLEAENLKLREALNNHRRNHGPQVFGQNEILNCGSEFNANKLSIPMTPSSSVPEREISRRPSLEMCRASKNSPHSSVHSSPEFRIDSELQTASTLKEAFSQTEKELRSTSVQCGEGEKETTGNGKPEEEKEVSKDVKTEPFFGTRKTENKENLKKKGRPFSDVNVQQITRQKKIISEHETRLLATLRGLQAELTVKDKETRKMKTEMDLLRIQIKRLSKNKVEGVKRCHIGTQTIGLGPVVQKPYNPEIYEAPNEYEKENEELKSQIKSLNENFELLKEKRIKDLQALHQLHEEEMGKLVSKLQTQSALTKHLHSLLVHR